MRACEWFLETQSHREPSAAKAATNQSLTRCEVIKKFFKQQKPESSKPIHVLDFRLELKVLFFFLLSCLPNYFTLIEILELGTQEYRKE